MTTDAPLFSIITVTKDNLKGFLATRESIEAQSCKNYEWIVIDGNSSDGTKDILPAGAVSEDDQGLYHAMNKGIARARGDYLLFLNAGDTLADMDILATLGRAAKEQPDFIYGDSLETGGTYKKARPHDKAAWGMFTHHQAMLYRRERIGGLRYDTGYKIAADYDFTARFLKGELSVHYIPTAICVFETGGISQRHMTSGRTEQFRARKSHGMQPWMNMAVFAGQTAAAAIKRLSPGIYALSNCWI
ncbi:MAG TPA: glycosyltransferase family 2 protein [Micavibrio sp.]|nr:glycosyltransferase family 2 protein [Micavibrio sp.]